MAENTNPDIRLVIGVDHEPSLEAMKKGVQSVIKELNKEKFKIDIDLSSKELKQFHKEVRSLLASMKNIGSGSFINPSALTNFSKSVSSSHKSILAIKDSVSDFGDGYESQINTLNSTYGRFKKSVVDLRANFAKGTVTKEEIANVSKLQAETTELINKMEAEVKSRKKLNKEREKTNVSVKENKKSDTDSSSSASATSSEIMSLEKKASCLTKIANLTAQCTANQKNWSAAATGSTKAEYGKYQFYIDQLSLLEKKLRDGELTLSEFNEDFSSIKSNFAQTNAIIKSAGKNVKSFADRFGTIASKLSAWFTAQKVLELAQRLLRQMVTNVKALDSAMTELKKVTDATDKQYTKFLEGAVARAKKLGATLVDTVSSSADMARLGYNLTDAAVLADTALIYKNVGDGISDIDEASSSIISTMQAFNVEAKDSLSIVDKFNTAGKYLCRAA